MTEAHSAASAAHPELKNWLTLLAEKINNEQFTHFVHNWENTIFSLFVVAVISLVVYLGAKRPSLVPGRLQSFLELIANGLDEFVCGILGRHYGKRYAPFIGTLFVYILLMNLLGLIPFMKSATSSLSITMALAVCVFIYVQYTAIKENGIIGFFDHLMGNPRGIIAFTLFVPLLLFFLHIAAEIIRPLSLALRLRSNVWAEDILLAVSAGFGLPGVPLMIFSMLLTVLSSVIQAVVFSLLSTIYFALILPHKEEGH